MFDHVDVLLIQITDILQHTTGTRVFDTSKYEDNNGKLSVSEIASVRGVRARSTRIPFISVINTQITRNVHTRMLRKRSTPTGTSISSRHRCGRMRSHSK